MTYFANTDKMTEFNLSNKIEPRMFDNGNDVDVLFPKDVKEFIKRRDKQVDDMYLDILALIETHKGTKQELIVKMNRLCLEHRIELNKLAGSDK